MPANASPPFLETELPHWAARGLANLMVGTFAAALLASFIIRMPETVACPFALVPVGGADPVRAAGDGTVIAIKVVDGQAVQAGETLFVIRSDVIGDKASELASLRVQQQGFRESLASAKRRHDQQRQSDDERSFASSRPAPRF
jgi:multidrug efflux pump subunit AcrA (membrane-fusion protein)